nr:hypothetical protein [Priestia taiwanensis]
MQDGRFILATTHQGLFLREQNTWKCLLTGFTKRIRDLHSDGKIIYGVGDEGIFIRSMDGGESWDVQRFPTKASSWNVCSDGEGLVIAHGDKVIYMSHNFGLTWKVVRPFVHVGVHAPSIRSLFLHRNQLFIGTKIHPVYGGVWVLQVETGEIRCIKKERDKMVSAITVSNGYIVVGSGACRGKSGNISFCRLGEIYNQQNIQWRTCRSEEQENSYLDLRGDGEALYTTSTQNEKGISTVSRICLEEERIATCGLIQGHGWRMAIEKDAYFIAGSTQSISSSFF